MDFNSTVYGFGIPPLVLGAIVAIGAVIQAARKRQFYWRYVFMFLAGIFQCIRNITFMVAALGGTEGSYSAYVSGSLSRVFMYQMFIPLMYSVFFEVCRTVINSSNPAAATGPAALPSGITANDLGSSPRTKLFSNARKLSPSYLAHLWTLIILVVNIAYCATLSSNLGSSSYSVASSVIGMLQFSTYGVWAYVAYAIAQLAVGWKELKCCSISLLSFFCTILIATIGNTVATVISSSQPIIATTMAINIISVIMVDVIGLLGLLFAVFASTRYWPPQPKSVTTNQPYYAYAQFSSGTSPQQQQQYMPQPPQMFMSTAAGSASQLYQQQQQQQYPIVQIPQQQLQSGQYPIVQIPISQQTQPGQQYPIVQVQPIIQQQYPQAGQFVGQQQYQ